MENNCRTQGQNKCLNFGNAAQAWEKERALRLPRLLRPMQGMLMNHGHHALKLPMEFLAGERVDRLPLAGVQLLPGRALLDAIQATRQSLRVTLTPAIASAELARRVGSAADRGVEVTVLLPHAAPLSMLWYARVDGWLSSGVKVFQSAPQPLGAAVCVADDHWSSVVFTNGVDPTGTPVDSRTELLIRDAGVARSLKEFFRVECAQARLVEQGAWPGPLGWLRWSRHMSEGR